MIKKQATIVLLAAALMLTACNMGATPAPTVDVNAINTAAYQTAVAQVSAGQTQTALAAPSATPTNTASTPFATVVLPGNGTVLPTAAGTFALPTVSFNNTPTTPLPGFTPLVSPVAPAATAALGDACNNSAFEGDITILDGSVIAPGTNFQKIWALRNTGTCTWDDGYSLVFIGGTKAIDPYDYNFSEKTDKDFVAGGEVINIAINLTAPCTPGKYEGHWRMRNDKGYYFGTILSVYIEVTQKDKNCGK